MAGSPTALQYLDKAVGTLRQLGLFPDKKGEIAPVVALLNQISELEPDKVTTIARTLDQMSLFKPITKRTLMATQASRIPEMMREAFRSALTPRRGPVALNLPRDLLEAVG